jgi:hypothetical protein
MALRGTRVRLDPIRGRAAVGRTPDQALYARLPAVYRLAARGLSRLPQRMRLRRLLVKRTTALAYAASNRRDFDVILVGLDPEFEYYPSKDLLPPDLVPVFRGHDGYLQLWRYWIDAFDDINWTPEEMIDMGDVLLVTTQQTGSGSGSGVALSKQVFQLYTLRRGLVLRQQDFTDFDEALRAADLVP